MNPELASRVRQSLMGHEGLMLKVYDDATGRVVNPGDQVKGWLTIGYGRNLVGRGITLGEADHLLGNDLANVERELDRCLGAWRNWSLPRQWAIVELGYNLGVIRFVTEWPQTATHLLAGRFREAAANLSASLWRRQVGDARALKVIRAIDQGNWT